MIRQCKLLIVLCILLAAGLAFGQLNYEKRIQDACPAMSERAFPNWKEGLMLDYNLQLVNLTLTYKQISENQTTFMSKDAKIVTGTAVIGIMTMTAYCYASDNFKKRFINTKQTVHLFDTAKQPPEDLVRVTVTGQRNEFKNSWDDSILI